MTATDVELPPIPVHVEDTPAGLVLVTDDGMRLPALDGRGTATLIMALFAGLNAHDPVAFREMMDAIAGAMTRLGAEVAALANTPPGPAH
ncbi:MAG: hypothetical protein AB7H88_08185 [Vicinamibacterales bacterium]